MNPDLLLRLQAMRPQIRARWEALLRIERLHTPLANPDTLVFMFDLTLDEVLSALPGRPVRSAGPRPVCRYDSNPMRAYFPALEQALLEALIHAQADQAAARAAGSGMPGMTGAACSLLAAASSLALASASALALASASLAKAARSSAAR